MTWKSNEGSLLVQAQWLGNGTRYGLEFYKSVAKGLKLITKPIPTFSEVTGEKLLGGLFAPPSWIGLKTWLCTKNNVKQNVHLKSEINWNHFQNSSFLKIFSLSTSGRSEVFCNKLFHKKTSVVDVDSYCSKVTGLSQQLDYNRTPPRLFSTKTSEESCFCTPSNELLLSTKPKFCLIFSKNSKSLYFLCKYFFFLQTQWCCFLSTQTP